ncbi:glycoside hydrolase family 5 protein [Peniophora sp. CONT]|nr:glycoside hydrolase family 5 protein [Peniophora sp. CONT]
MPRVPSTSSATGAPCSSDMLHTIGGHFVDSSGRTIILRGVNLSGSSKAPVGMPSYVLDGFWEAAQDAGSSFVGRPLDLDDGSADVHLARLKGWGFNCLRFPVVWEALEHEGPGKYDYEFMDYTIRVLRKCHEYGFKIYMDPHQDAWSRFSGGSGAPYWTIEACGLNARNFTATQAAVIHSEYPLAHEPDPANIPAMTWSTNYGRLAIQTLFTLFFAGKAYAPRCIIDGQNIQDYLQNAYIAALGALADRIASEAPELLDTCIIGWDSMNEPGEGFVGCADLNVLPTEQGSVLKKGPTPTPAQGLRLGMGQAQTVEHWTFGTFGPSKDGTVTIDPRGLRAWLDPSTEPDSKHPRYGWTRDPGWELGSCIWAQHGVWDIETGYVLKPDYFAHSGFIAEFWRPHWEAYGRRMRQAHPEAILFVAPPVFAQPPEMDEQDLKGRAVYSTHYYDGLTLVSRKWNFFNADALGLLRGKYKHMIQAVVLGESAIRKSLRTQLGILKSDAEIIGGYPTMIGEIGIPYDMDGRAAYYGDGKRRGDYKNQRRALDASLNACDGPNALSYSIWTYCPDNSHKWGDGWNMEDLSLWSADDLRDGGAVYTGAIGDKSSALLLQRSTAPSMRAGPMPGSQLSLATIPGPINPEGAQAKATVTVAPSFDFLTDGARAVRAFARPYPMATVGAPTSIEFDCDKSEFRLTVRVTSEDASSEPTIVYLPAVHYAADTAVGSLLAQSADMEDATESAAGGRSGASSSSETLPGDEGEMALAVDIEVSEGKWEVDGNTQVLRWWYDAPGEGKEPGEVKLVVKRRGGRIWTGEEVREREGGGPWERVCGPLGVCAAVKEWLGI